MVETLEDRLVPAGGPVILGGDDLTDHGSINGTTLQDGWLYIRRALENIAPSVTRPSNNGSVVVLGSSDSTATFSDAGAAYHFAVPQAAVTVPAKLSGVIDFRDGAAAINTFFTQLAGGVVQPAIIVIAGTESNNDLDAAEGAALTTNATTIAGFVSSGGGLIGHGGDGANAAIAYGWLSTLLPGLTAIASGDSGDLALTPAGQTAFPGVTNTDINAGPWHNHFEPRSALGGLQVLAIDSNTNDAQGLPRAVIIGGAQVVIGPPLPGPNPVPPPVVDTGLPLERTLFFPHRPSVGRRSASVLGWFIVTNRDVAITTDLTIVLNLPGVTIQTLKSTKVLAAKGINTAGKPFITIRGGLKVGETVSVYMRFTYPKTLSLDGMRKLLSIDSTAV